MGLEICPISIVFKISKISLVKDFELIQPKLPLLLAEDEMLYLKAAVSNPSLSYFLNLKLFDQY